ncbi:MAG: hypothetical protein JW940_11675 [Polyangiaceae bacterium]|nr:hypothetical protein [Polyangiaceae bacterium]
MNPTHHRLEAALDAWPVPELSAELSARTLTRTRATLRPCSSLADALDLDRKASRAALARRLFVPVVLGAAATVLVVDTCLKIQRIFGA